MIDLATLAASAIELAAKYLAKKTADAAASSLGEKIVEWLKHKLISPSERQVMGQLTHSPTSEGARRSAEGALLSRLESDPSLAQSFRSLFSEHEETTILNLSVSGQRHTVVQASGASTVTISKIGDRT
jgi:hypothetical protein